MFLCLTAFYRPQTKSSAVKKQLSQKGRKSRKQDSSAEDDDEEDDDDDDDDDEDDTPKRQTRRRGATKVKRCISQLGDFTVSFPSRQIITLRTKVSVLTFIHVVLLLLLQLQRGPA